MKTWSRAGIVLFGLLLTVPAVVFGENLDDFRTAAGYDKGVELIPFQDLRRDANSIAEDVQRRKDEVASYKYSQLESEKNNHLKAIRHVKTGIEDLQKSIQNYERRSSEVGVDFTYLISSLKDEIKVEEKWIDEKLNGEIKKKNEEMAKAIDSYDRLYQARAGLREYFDKALSRLSDAKSSPEKYLGSSPSDDDKNKLKNYIETIQDKIKSEASKHKIEEDNAKTKKAEYESLMRKTE